MNKPSIPREILEQKSVDELLQLLTDKKRIQNARRIYTTDIRIIFQSEQGYMYEIKGAKQKYFLKIDIKNKALVHNCSDWLHRGMRDSKLCKHFIKIFQLLYEKEAKAILIDLNIHSWAFLDSDNYLKSL